jgi:hypothetical protein
MLVYEERRAPFVGAPNEVIGRFESRFENNKMASIFELNNKPFILHILNLRIS